MSPNQRVVTAADYASNRYLFRVSSADWLDIEPAERILPGDLLLIDIDITRWLTNASLAGGRLCVLRLAETPPRFAIRRSSRLAVSGVESIPGTRETAENRGEVLRYMRLPDTLPEEKAESNGADTRSDDFELKGLFEIIGVVLRNVSRLLTQSQS